MRVAVTGASGHLGGVLVRRLLAADHEVDALDLVEGAALAGLGHRFRRVDVLDRSALVEAFDGIEVVFHLAAVISVAGDPTGEVWRINVGGTGNVADAALAAGVRRLVHASSVHAFDLARCEEPLDETGPRADAPDLPVYDRSKWAGERALRERVEAGLDAVIVNPTGVIGPHDHGPSRMGRVVRAAAAGRLWATVPGGFDWVDVRDVVDGMISAVERGRTGESYLLSGHWATIRQVAALAAPATGRPSPRVTIPYGVARAIAPLGTFLTRRRPAALSLTTEALETLRHGPRVSSAKAENELGYGARPLEVTVRDAAAWFARPHDA